MAATDTLFAKPISRIICAGAVGFAASFVLGSFISFFVFFNASAIEGQAASSARPVVFRIFAAIFLLVGLAFHLYASLTFRYSESKKVFDLGAPRPVICAAIVGLMLIANAIPSSTEVRDDSKFVHADNPYIRESKFGWPGYFVSFYDEHGKKETRMAMSLLIVNGLILLLSLANVAVFDPTSRTLPEKDEDDKKDDKKKKKDTKDKPPEDDDWVPPQMAPKAD
jgi:hypothetical protein